MPGHAGDMVKILAPRMLIQLKLCILQVDLIEYPVAAAYVSQAVAALEEHLDGQSVRAPDGLDDMIEEIFGRSSSTSSLPGSLWLKSQTVCVPWPGVGHRTGDLK